MLWKKAVRVSQKLDISAMNEAAACLIGEHDFSAFRGAGCQSKSHYRHVIDANWTTRGAFLIFNINFKTFINPHSLKTIKAYVEPGLKSAKPGDHFQFQRQGYFVLDKDSSGSKLIFNKTVGLRDTWSKLKK